MSNATMLAMLGQVCDVLIYLERKQVTHGDLTSRNIFLLHDVADGPPIIKVGDFGLAWHWKEPRPRALMREERGDFYWLPSPRCNRPKSTDVFAFGMLCIEVVIVASHTSLLRLASTLDSDGVTCIAEFTAASSIDEKFESKLRKETAHALLEILGRCFFPQGEPGEGARYAFANWNLLRGIEDGDDLTISDDSGSDLDVAVHPVQSLTMPRSSPARPPRRPPVRTPHASCMIASCMIAPAEIVVRKLRPRNRPERASSRAPANNSRLTSKPERRWLCRQRSSRRSSRSRPRWSARLPSGCWKTSATSPGTWPRSSSPPAPRLWTTCAYSYSCPLARPRLPPQPRSLLRGGILGICDILRAPAVTLSPLLAVVWR